MACLGRSGSSTRATPRTNTTWDAAGSPQWGKLDADGKCNTMLHELLHWAGDQGSSDHNDPNGRGDDDVYSCGRYCGNCSDALQGSPPLSARP
jgi:hypothetical protein